MTGSRNKLRKEDYTPFPWDVEGYRKKCQDPQCPVLCNQHPPLGFQCPRKTVSLKSNPGVLIQRSMKKSSIFIALFLISFHSDLWILKTISILYISESPASCTAPGRSFGFNQYFSNKKWMIKSNTSSNVGVSLVIYKILDIAF